MLRVCILQELCVKCSPSCLESQAILAQGVLLMNAACTIKPVEGTRAGEVVEALWSVVTQTAHGVSKVLADAELFHAL